MVRLIFIAAVAAAVFWCRRGEAAAVAILRPANDTTSLREALFRLQGELVAVGLAVVITDRPPFDDTDSAEASSWFEETATERGIDAFIDVVGDTKPVAVDVWICERAPPRLRIARVVLEPDAENAATTLAIRAIEVLRSSFLALDLAKGSRTRAPPSPPIRAKQAAGAPEPGARLALEAGATALTGLDGIGPAVLPLARLDWALRSWLSVQLTGAGFGTRPRLETVAGSVRVTQQFAVLGLCVCETSAPGIHPVVALSAGALRSSLDGRARAPNLGHHVAQSTFVVDGSAGARLSFPGWFYLTLASHVQLTAPYLAIHVVDSVVATMGRPNLLLTLTAGARL